MSSGDLGDFLATLTGQGKPETVGPATKKIKVVRKQTGLSEVSKQTDETELEMFGLTDLNKFEHCARTLQKAIRMIVDEAPDLNMLKKVAKNKSLDEFARQEINDNLLLHMVCELKTRYSTGKLGFFDEILQSKSLVKDDSTVEPSVHSAPSSHSSHFMNEGSKSPSPSVGKTYDASLDSDTPPNGPPNTNIPELNTSLNQLPPLPKIHSNVLHKRVFSHKSLSANKTYLAEEEIVSQHNERLEFLGDSVLNYVATLLLYERFPYAKEGFMSFWRSNLVCNKTLAAFSYSYKFDALLRSKVEAPSLITGRQKIFADIFEAYIGAVAIDRQYDLKEIEEWLGELMAPMLASAEVELKKNAPINKDAKTQLYSLIGSAMMHPVYKVTGHSTSFNGAFVVQCMMGEEVLGKGSAPNLKDAGLRAAMNALSNKKLVDKYVRLRLDTDRTSSVVKASSTATDGDGKTDVAPDGGKGTKFPLVADQSVVGNKFAKNEVYAYFNQNLGVNPEYKSIYQEEEKRYLCELKVKDTTLAIVYDSSKKNGESRAAALILLKKHLLHDMMNEIL